MHKTKLGISVALMGTLICTVALLFGHSIWLLAIIAYVLIKEDNEWLKKLALRVGVIVLAYVGIFLLVNLVTNAFSFINTIIYEINEEKPLKWPFSLDSIILSASNFIKNFLLIAIGFKSLSQRNIKLNIADKFVNKHS